MPQVAALLFRAEGRSLCRPGRTNPTPLVVVAPVLVVAFGSFVGLRIVRDQGWIEFAVGVLTWSGFVGGVLSGMVVHARRRLLHAGEVSPALLLAVAWCWAVVLVVAQYAVLVIVVAVSGQPVPNPQLLAPVVVALTLGLGLGILIARLAASRPYLAGLAPGLVALSLLALPVLWGAPAVGDVGRAWIRNGPMASMVVSARGRAAGADLDVRRVCVASAAAVVLVSAAGFGLRRRRPGDPPDGVALTVSGVRVDPGLPGRLDLCVTRGERVALVDQGDGGRSRVLALVSDPAPPGVGAVRRTAAVAEFLRPADGFHPGVPAVEAVRLRGLAIGQAPGAARGLAERVMTFVDLGPRARVPVGRLTQPELARLAAAYALERPADLVLWNDDLLHPQPTFRQRCLLTIGDRDAGTRTGRGWLIGTTDLGKVGEFSDRVVQIGAGEVRVSGSAQEVVARMAAPRFHAIPDTGATESCRVLAVSLVGPRGEPITVVEPGDPIHLVIDLDLAVPETEPFLLCSLSAGGTPFVAANMLLDGCRPAVLAGTTRVECRFERLILAPRTEYAVRFAIYGADRMTVVYPKRAIASFVTGGTASALGLEGREAESRITGGPPVFAPYAWRHSASADWVGPAGPLRPR